MNQQFWLPATSDKTVGTPRVPALQFHVEVVANKPNIKNTILVILSYGRSFFLPFMAQSRSKEGKKRGSITCRADRENKANQKFILWLCWLFRDKNEIIWRFDKWSRASYKWSTATYGPEIDQSQRAKSVSHIIKPVIKCSVIKWYSRWSRWSSAGQYIIHMYSTF